MNERIKTLIKESGGHNIAYEGRPGSYSYAFTDNSMEKFVRLIAEDCARLCDNLQDIPATEPRHCAEDIRIDFEVNNDDRSTS